MDRLAAVAVGCTSLVVGLVMVYGPYPYMGTYFLLLGFVTLSAVNLVKEGV